MPAARVVMPAAVQRVAIVAALAAIAVVDAATAAEAAVASMVAAAEAVVSTVVEAAATAVAVDTGKIRLNAKNKKPALLRQAGFLRVLRLFACP
jgi:hypothetical protein